MLEGREAVRKLGVPFMLAKCDSEKGLSFETWGRLCERSTPRSASSRATLFGGRRAPVGVDRGLARADPLALAALGDQAPRERTGLAAREQPPHDEAAGA